MIFDRPSYLIVAKANEVFRTKVGVVMRQIDNGRLTADAAFHSWLPGSGPAGNNRTDFHYIIVKQQCVTAHQRAVGDDQHRFAVHGELGNERMHAYWAINCDFSARVA